MRNLIACKIFEIIIYQIRGHSALHMDMAKCWQLDFFVFPLLLPLPALLAGIVVVDAWQLCRNYEAAHGNAVAIL